MATSLQSIDTNHADMIHDSQFDYYAKKLATCSSDKSVKVFDVNLHTQQTLHGHEGPVWQVAWAHPKFGVLLASCSYDKTVLIHKEAPANTWTKIYQHSFHQASVNSVAWAPHEYGLILACASSDGYVSLLEFKEEQWVCSSFQNDTLGCNAVSWAPYSALGSVNSAATDGEQPVVRRLVTASCDNTVRIWRHQTESEPASWVEEEKDAASMAGGHSDWVRDVAWAPNTAMPYNIIASCSEDEKVLIWKQTQKDMPWTCQPLTAESFGAPVWRVSWSVTGNVLAVATGDQKVSLWKQGVDEVWVKVSSLSE